MSPASKASFVRFARRAIAIVERPPSRWPREIEHPVSADGFRMPGRFRTPAATRSGPDLRLLDGLGMNVGGAFKLDGVVRFGDHVRHVVGQESAGLALP